MTLRPYQHESVNAVWDYLCSSPGNPVVVMPTGSGKSHVIAQLATDAVRRFNGEVLILQHRKELIEQNAAKIAAACDLPVGIYSAGLGRRDTDQPILLAGIQSVYQRAEDLGARKLVIVDEVHLVPHEGDGMYRQLFADLRLCNERMRAVGLTATPWRTESGPICRPDGIFNRVCYSADIQELIGAGYLCNLVSRPAVATVDTSGLRVARGEFVQIEAEYLFGNQDVVEVACAEIVAATENRRSVLVFCSGVLHAEHVAETLTRLAGEPCEVVTGETLPLERAATLERFRTGQTRYLANVDVLTTGFDAPNIDCVAILRATMSPGLFAQMCGRGFRLCSGKSDCLILDFGENLKRHGPIDAIDYGRQKSSGQHPGEAPTKECPNCGEALLIAARECGCGFQFPEPESRHGDKADTDTPVLSEPEEWTVIEVEYFRHEKKKAQPGAPPTLRVDYTVLPAEAAGGNLEEQVVQEWVCLEHEGYARTKAVRWWQERSIAPVPETVDEAVHLARGGAVASASRITTRREGKWARVVRHELDERPEDWGDEIVGNPWESETEDYEVPF